MRKVTSRNDVLDDGHIGCHKHLPTLYIYKLIKIYAHNLSSVVTGHFGKSFLWSSDSQSDHTLQILSPQWLALNTPLSEKKKKKERKLSSHGTVFFGKRGIGEGQGLMAMRDLSVILTFNNPWLSIFCCLFILTSGWTHFRGSLCARKFTEHSAWKRRTCHLESISPQGRLQQSTHHTHTHTTRIHSR